MFSKGNPEMRRLYDPELVLKRRGPAACADVYPAKARGHTCWGRSRDERAAGLVGRRRAWLHRRSGRGFRWAWALRGRGCRYRGGKRRQGHAAIIAARGDGTRLPQCGGGGLSLPEWSVQPKTHSQPQKTHKPFLHQTQLFQERNNDKFFTSVIRTINE